MCSHILKTFHHNLAQDIALNNGKTRAAEQSTNEQKKIPESVSSVCCCEFSPFLDHRVGAFSWAAAEHTRSHTQTRKNTHRAHMHKAAVSHSAKLPQILRTCSHSVKLFASPLRCLKNILEHMNYWSNQSKCCSRNTNISFFTPKRRDGDKNDDRVSKPIRRVNNKMKKVFCFSVSKKNSYGRIHQFMSLFFNKKVGILVYLVILSLFYLFWLHNYLFEPLIDAQTVYDSNTSVKMYSEAAHH